MKNILVIGGAGYVGAVLVPKLLDQGYAVRVLDLMLFGEDVLPQHPSLEVVKGDMRDKDVLAAANRDMDAVIQLACISNDPSFELDPELSKSINFDAIEPTVAFAQELGLTRFVYASTSSVYGVSEAPEVTEDHPLVPLTDYNKYKGLTEPQVIAHHVVKNAIGPALSMGGLQLGFMFAGVVVVEQVFSWPGIGNYLAASIPVADFPAIAGVTLVLGTIYVLSNLVVDLLQALADPRVAVE